MSGSFKLSLDDGSCVEGTYKINIEAKLCVVSVHDIADIENVDKSKWNGEGIECCNTPDSCNFTTHFDDSTDKDTGRRGISMARVVINILSAIAAKQSGSQKPGSACCNGIDKSNIETDGIGQQSEYRSNDKIQIIDQVNSLPCIKNTYTNANMSRTVFPTTMEQTIPYHDTPNIHENTGYATYSSSESRKLPFKCGKEKDSADANAHDQLNAHEQGTIPNTMAEKKQIKILDGGGSLISSDVDGDNQANKANLSEGQGRANICTESPTNPIDRFELTTKNHTDNLCEILSNKSNDTHGKRNIGTEDISKSEEDNCSASDGSQWSLKKIMDEYDEKYPDEDEEANSFQSTSTYHYNA